VGTFAGTPEGASINVKEQVNPGGRIQLELHSSWGEFVLRQATEAEMVMDAMPTTRSKTTESSAKGVVGIVEVSLPIASGTAASIARFYETVFGFPVQLSPREGGASDVIVSGGPAEGSQRLRFYECSGGSKAPAYNGDHFCIYIGDFEACFERCRERGILYVNPRFTWLDDSRTLEQARHWQAFRIMDVREDKDGAVLFTEEHEIRSCRHDKLSLNPSIRASEGSENKRLRSRG